MTTISRIIDVSYLSQDKRMITFRDVYYGISGSVGPSVHDGVYVFAMQVGSGKFEQRVIEGIPQVLGFHDAVPVQEQMFHNCVALNLYNTVSSIEGGSRDNLKEES